MYQKRLAQSGAAPDGSVRLCKAEQRVPPRRTA